MTYKYITIANSLRKQIQSGQYISGELLPEQNKIAESFGTTRITVHKALQLLITEGLVYSKQGSGTYVRKDYNSTDKNDTQITPIDKPLGATKSNAGKKVTSKIIELSTRMPTNEEADKLLIKESEPVYIIQRVRYVDGKIFAYEYTVMPTAITTLTQDILENSIYNHLQTQGLKLEGSHRIIKAAKATSIDVENGIAQTLGEPVLVVNQLSYLADGQPFELAESHFPYEQSELTVNITL